MEDSDSIDRFPILVGVIGHRDLLTEKIPEYESKLRAALSELQKKAGKAPIFVVTSLAEGADLLGAKVARELDIPLVALLPMELEEYKQTFSSPENISLLDSYYKSSSVKHVCTAYDQSNQGSLDDKYARAGAAVMQYSHVVIALWNGISTGLEAGTSFLVEHAIRGIPRRLIYDLEGTSVSPLDPVSTAVVRRIPVARISNPTIQQPTFDGLVIEGKFEDISFSGKGNKANLLLGKDQKKVFRNFDRFNRDAKRFRPKTGDWASALAYPPIVPEESAHILNPGLKYLRERFAAADFMALHFQKQRYFVFLQVMILLTSVIAFVHQIVNSKLEIKNDFSVPFLPQKFFELINWPFVLYGLLIILGILIGTLMRWKRWQDRYLDYRTIAEATRTQFFWLLSGIRPPVVHSFLRKQQDELEWVRSVVRIWYLRAFTQGGLVDHATIAEARLIEDHWIVDQLNYHQKKAIELRRVNFRQKWASSILISLLILTVVLGAIYQDDKLEGTSVELKYIFIVSGALSGAAAVLISSRRYFFHVKELQKSSERMFILYSNAKRFYDPNDGIQDEEKALLYDLGREALTETGDWLLANRERRVKVGAKPV